MNRIKYYFLIILLFNITIVRGQEGKIPRTIRRWIQIGYLHHFYTARGAEWGKPGQVGNFKGLRWPANYSEQNNFTIIRTWLVCRDFTDEKGKQWPYKSAYMGGMEPGNSVPMKLEMISKNRPPTVYVDGALAADPADPEIDKYDPNLPSDRKIVNVVNTPLGITMTRNIYAFSQEYHSNYFIIEFILENTGNTDADDEIELPDQEIKELYLGWLDHYGSTEGGRYVQGGQAYGKFLWRTHRGETYDQYLQGDQDADSMRCTWAWLGLVQGLDYDNIGAPIVEGSGRLANAQYPGMIYLHVDKSAQDSTDDPNKPVMGWNGNDTHPESAQNGNNVSGNRTLFDMFAGNGMPQNGQYGGYDRMDERGAKYPQNLADAGGAAGVAGFGPYNLKPGEKVRIVVAEGVSGISRKLCKEVGYNWKYGQAPYELPDGSTTNDRDEYKNSWVFTGQDSILQTFSRARRNFESGFNIPQPPQPPKAFYVNSMGDKIQLKWQDPLGGYGANFKGFKIYRAIGKRDTTYQQIFSCSLPDTVHEFNDNTAKRGFSYYYYITAYSDGSPNNGTLNPAGELESSLFYTRTSLPAYLRRPAAESLEEIRVVPNPYNISAREHQYGVNEDRDQIMFFNLPGECKIKIYTERGDLIKTINHNDGTGDESWNSNTIARQVVASGIYIAYFETPDGQSTYRKIIIIR